MTYEILDKANSIEQARKTVDKLLFDILKDDHVQIGTEDGKTVRLDEINWTIRDQIIATLISNLQEIRKQLIDEFNKL